MGRGSKNGQDRNAVSLDPLNVAYKEVQTKQRSGKEAAGEERREQGTKLREMLVEHEARVFAPLHQEDEQRR